MAVCLIEPVIHITTGTDIIFSSFTMVSICVMRHVRYGDVRYGDGFILRYAEVKGTDLFSVKGTDLFSTIKDPGEQHFCSENRSVPFFNFHCA